MERQDARNIALLFAICMLAKLMLVMVVYYVPAYDIAGILHVSPALLEHNWRALNWSYDERPLMEKLGHTFDSQHYVDIARNGYPSAVGGGGEGMSAADMCAENGWMLYKWAPFYPLLIRLAAAFVGFVPAGLLVSNLASLAAAALFYAVCRRYVDGATSLRASVLFVMFPYNLTFFTGSFSEPVYVVFLLASWIYFERGDLSKAGLLAMFAAFTRYPGIMLFPVYSIIWLARNRGVGIKPTIRNMALMNVPALLPLAWMFVAVPMMTGHSLAQLGSLCFGYGLTPGGAIVEATALGWLCVYFALLAAYHMKGLNPSLRMYAFMFLVFHLSVAGTGASIGRYIGAIWPIFIYYGRELDRVDTAFYSCVFLAIAAVMMLLHANTITWI